MVESPNRNDIRVGIELAGAYVTGVAADASGSVLRRVSLAITDDIQPVDALIKVLGDVRSGSEIQRIGVAVPGLVDSRSGRVAYSALGTERSDPNLAGTIASATGVEVVLENDANAAAYAEYVCGAGRGAQDLFYATLGDGVGGSFIFGGEIWHGASGFAGEFGYIPINSEGMRLEEVASAANIIRRTKSRFHQDSTSSLGRLSAESLRLEDIISAAQQEDDFAQMMLGRTGVYVGTAIASVINLLNIERIVIGGAIMEAKRAVLGAIIERARELSFAPSFEATKIVAGELGANAAAIGAALVSVRETV